MLVPILLVTTAFSNGDAIKAMTRHCSYMASKILGAKYWLRALHEGHKSPVIDNFQSFMLKLGLIWKPLKTFLSERRAHISPPNKFILKNIRPSVRFFGPDLN